MRIGRFNSCPSSCIGCCAGTIGTICFTLTFILHAVYWGSSTALRETKPYNCTIDGLAILSTECPTRNHPHHKCSYTLFNVSFLAGERIYQKAFDSPSWQYHNPYSAYEVGQTRVCYLILTPQYDIKNLLWTIPTKSDVKRHLALFIAVPVVSALLLILLAICTLDIHICKPKLRRERLPTLKNSYELVELI